MSVIMLALVLMFPFLIPVMVLAASKLDDRFGAWLREQDARQTADRETGKP